MFFRILRMFVVTMKKYLPLLPKVSTTLLLMTQKILEINHQMQKLSTGLRHHLLTMWRVLYKILVFLESGRIIKFLYGSCLISDLWYIIESSVRYFKMYLYILYKNVNCSFFDLPYFLCLSFHFEKPWQSPF